MYKNFNFYTSILKLFLKVAKQVILYCDFDLYFSFDYGNEDLSKLNYR